MSEYNETIKYLMQAIELISRAKVVMIPKFDEDPRVNALNMALLAVREIIESMTNPPPAATQESE